MLSLAWGECWAHGKASAHSPRHLLGCCQGQGCCQGIVRRAELRLFLPAWAVARLLVSCTAGRVWVRGWRRGSEGGTPCRQASLLPKPQDTAARPRPPSPVCSLRAKLPTLKMEPAESRVVPASLGWGAARPPAAEGVSSHGGAHVQAVLPFLLLLLLLPMLPFVHLHDLGGPGLPTTGGVVR